MWVGSTGYSFMDNWRPWAQRCLPATELSNERSSPMKWLGVLPLVNKKQETWDMGKPGGCEGSCWNPGSRPTGRSASWLYLLPISPEDSGDKHFRSRRRAGVGLDDFLTSWLVRGRGGLWAQLVRAKPDAILTLLTRR